MSSGHGVYIGVTKQDGSPFEESDQVILRQAIERCRVDGQYVNYEKEPFMFTMQMVTPMIAQIELSKYYGSSDHSDEDGYGDISKAVDHDLVLAGRIERELGKAYDKVFSFEALDEYW